MLQFLSFLIKTGIEFLFIIMLLASFLRLGKHKRLVPSLFYGSLLGIVIAIILYLTKKYIIRMEMIDLVEKGFLFSAILLGMISVILLYRQNKTRFGKITLFLFSFAIALEFEQILLTAIPQLRLVNGINSEWIGKVAVTAITVLFLYIMALGIQRLAQKQNVRFIFFIVFLQFLILSTKELTEFLQMLFSLQILPLTMWALEILAPVVNHKEYFFYILALTIGLFLVKASILIYHHSKAKDGSFLNPADKRKVIAKSLTLKRWFYSLTIIHIAFFSFLVSSKIIQANELNIKPPIETTAHEGHIHISNNQLKKGLNIFSYTFPDQTETRFMVVSKTENNYAVALDACSICGVAGYYQKGDQIICKKCHSVINVNTIGLPGGCNPITMAYESQDNKGLDIQVSELEKSKSLFQ